MADSGRPIAARLGAKARSRPHTRAPFTLELHGARQGATGTVARVQRAGVRCPTGPSRAPVAPCRLRSRPRGAYCNGRVRGRR